jgi:CBS domain-containing protein
MKAVAAGELRRRATVANLYRFSDLSIEAIGHQVDMETSTVQKIVDELVKESALVAYADQSTTTVETIMTAEVFALDGSKTVAEAAAMMADKQVGSVIVTRNGRPYGIVTQSDIVRWAGLRRKLLDSNLDGVATIPLISVGPKASIEDASKIMLQNRIHKLPVIEDGRLVGIITVTDLAGFLSPSRRPGLALSVLQVVTRGKSGNDDSKKLRRR